MADLSNLETIEASSKPTADDFAYIYAESVNKAFVRIAKDELQKIILDGKYTNEEIDQKLSTIPKFNIEVVSSLPTTDISETTIYLVSSGDDSENLYTEYININGLWEILGTQKSTFSGSAKDVTYDDTETKLGATNVQDAFGKLSATINNLPSTGGSGLTNAQINLLDAIGDYIPFKSAEGGAKWDELIASLRGGSSGGEEPDTPTEATLSSISAIYNGGEVTTGTELSDLKGITVTGTYSDGTTKTITGYTLSGEILEGENTITVSYSGKTATFKVTGIVESGGNAELPTDGLVDYFDFRTCEYNNTGSGGTTFIQPTQGNGQLYTWANNAVLEQSNDYGIRLNRSFSYSLDKDTTQDSCGNAFTWVFKSYLTNTSSPLFTNDYGSLSNLMKIGYRPKYNKTDGSNAQVALEGLGERLSGGGYELLSLVVDNNICKLYFGNELVKEIDGNTIDSFASWYDKLVCTSLGDVNYVYASQLAIYNKALSEVEITEMKAYLETLEVA